MSDWSKADSLNEWLWSLAGYPRQSRSLAVPTGEIGEDRDAVYVPAPRVGADVYDLGPDTGYAFLYLSPMWDPREPTPPDGWRVRPGTGLVLVAGSVGGSLIDGPVGAYAVLVERVGGGA